MSSAKVGQLQLQQKNLQNLLTQKQQLESHITELDSALENLKDTTASYKVMGRIMVATPKEELVKDLEAQKKDATTQLNNFSSQEEKIKANIDKLQKEVVEELKKKNDK